MNGIETINLLSPHCAYCQRCTQNKKCMIHNFIIFTFLFLCLSSNANSLSKKVVDKRLDKFFNVNEQTELKILINFVDSIVLTTTNEKNIELAYHYYFDSLLYKKPDKGEIAINQEEKYNFIFNLNSELVNEIWTIDSIVKSVKTRDTVLYDLVDFPNIYLNSTGKYMDYLKQLGKKDRYFRALYKTIMTSGDLPPSAVAGFLYYNKNFDFKTIEYRLWAAVFTLTLEESVESKVKRYLKE